MVLGLVALASGKTGDLITLSVFGALTMYGASTLAMLRLRRTEPDLVRPFRTPGAPVVPVVAAVTIGLSLVAMGISNPKLAAIFLGVIAVGYGWLFALVPKAKRG
jgi:ethanolamine permease